MAELKEVWGLDIGGTKCAFITGNLQGQVLSRKEVAAKAYPTWEAVLLALLPESGKPLCIGVRCGGPLDEDKGLILSPPHLPGWDEVPITAWLTEHYHAPAFLQNVANACALAEWRFGAGKGTKNMIFLTFGTGFGAGLILDGRLYHGTNGNAGEVGHVRAAEDGPVGYGKAGSYEGYCSGGGIAQLSGGKSAKAVAAAAEAGDEQMRAVLKESATKLGYCLSMLIDLFNPERVVIGSIFARAEKWFRADMEAVIAREALDSSAAVCQVVPAALGDSIGDIAALTVAIQGLEKDNVIKNQYKKV